MKGEGERVVKIASCVWFDDKLDVGVGFMNMAIGMMLE